MDDKTIYCQRNKERLLNKEKEYYENNKERIREKSKNEYGELSEEEKNIKRILYIRLPPMNTLAKYFKDGKYMNLLSYDKELLKKLMQYGIKLVVYLKENLIVNQCIKINI